MKKIFIVFALLFVTSYVSAQVGYGFSVTNDLYQYYVNPEDDTGDSRSAGSALLNFGIGPKLWFGGQDFSFSIEGQASIGLLGLSAKDYKGLGVVSIPLMAKFNFAGLSGLDKEMRFGWSFGGGIQYSRTELYYVTDDFVKKGGKRAWYKTYIAQVGYGIGISGVTGQAFVRGGYNSETKACNASIGFQVDFNLEKMKEIDAPESRL